jgi:hypothetical protein
MSATAVPMPARGDRTAPNFDPKQPRELRRYFSELEFHFTRSSVTAAEEKKKHACRFVDVDTSELWESLPEYTDHAVSYVDFMKAVHALYPGSDEERKWSVADMDKLVGERCRLGVLSLSDLGEYYRQFLAITTFLRGKSRLSEAEQSRAFTRGFQPDLWGRISQRLQLKFPDQFPDDPYSLDAIHEAARYVLHGTSSALLTSSIATSTPAVARPTTAPEIKMEDITTIIERLTDTFVKALAASNNNYGDRPPRPPRESNPGCNFCGDLDHFVRECQIALEFIRLGKCKRNVEGKITLPSGAFLPRDIPGKYYKDRIDEWHRRNPNQLAAGAMMYGVLSNGISEPQRHTTVTRPSDVPESVTSPALQLSAQDRIDSLERELYQLRGRGPRTRAQHAINREDSPDPIPRNLPVPTPAAPKKARFVPEVVIPCAPPPPAVDEPVAEAPAVIEPPVHPFADARDGTYAAPQQRNFAALPKPAPAKKADPAYRTFAPIYDGKIAADVYDHAMSSQVTLTQRELLSLSPEVRVQVREAVSAKRNANKDDAKEIHTLADTDTLAFTFDDLEPDIDPPASVFTNAIQRQTRSPPPGSLVIPDPYETYLKSLPQGQIPDQLVVAKESSALRSILPLVDNQQQVEAILDPGSQIIAMAEEVCIDLALIYDPEIVLNMQSANGEIDKSLGLARNVPLRIGDITLYVQIHIIRSPAYDILLGRPFDILTESVVRNYANEDQMVTIFDPNSGRRATVPTMARGRPRRVIQRTSFTASRS